MEKRRYCRTAGTVLNGYASLYGDDLADNRDRIRIAPEAEGIERLEAHLHGQAFSPHSHDTYAIGVTVSGVQTFRFRGALVLQTPGIHALDSIKGDNILR